MIHLYPVFKKKAALFSMSFGLLCSLPLFSQVCGPIVENFDNTGGSMAGFTSSTLNSTQPGFVYSKPGLNGFLQRCSVSSGGTVYQITTPTYQTTASQTVIGYGFELSGAVTINNVDVFLQYPDNTGGVNSVKVTTISPSYSGPAPDGVATICGTVTIGTFTGFNPGDRYRFIFQLTTASSSSNTQCVTFDNFRTNSAASAITLPVSFTGFTARKLGTSIQLVWNVAGERDVNRYEVERSANGRDFVKMGEVKASGASAYAFADNQPIAGLNYYRVKNLDIDGKGRYSAIARINISRIIAFKAFPQPATSQVTIEHSFVDAKGRITLTSASGQVVKTVEVKPDINETVIDLSGVRPGVYLVRFDNGNGRTETLKLVKQ